MEARTLDYKAIRPRKIGPKSVPVQYVHNKEEFRKKIRLGSLVDLGFESFLVYVGTRDGQELFIKQSNSKPDEIDLLMNNFDRLEFNISGMMRLGRGRERRTIVRGDENYWGYVARLENVRLWKAKK